MDLPTCLMLVEPYDELACVTIEAYLGGFDDPGHRDNTPLVWRGKHCHAGSTGYVMFTSRHTGRINVLGQLAMVDVLPTTRSQLLELITFESLDGSLATRSRSYGIGQGIVQHEQTFLSRGWYVSFQSIADGHSQVSYCPSAYTFDEIDLRIIHGLGLDPRNEEDLDPISY